MSDEHHVSRALSHSTPVINSIAAALLPVGSSNKVYTIANGRRIFQRQLNLRSVDSTRLDSSASVTVKLDRLAHRRASDVRITTLNSQIDEGTLDEGDTQMLVVVSTPSADPVCETKPIERRIDATAQDDARPHCRRRQTHCISGRCNATRMSRRRRRRRINEGSCGGGRLPPPSAAPRRPDIRRHLAAGWTTTLEQTNLMH